MEKQINNQIRPLTFSLNNQLIEDAVIIEEIAQPKQEERNHVSSVDSSLTKSTKRSPFIEANSSGVSLSDLRKDFIPVFAKDNESTLSHHEFIECIYDAAGVTFPHETLSSVECRVSHKICGRVPSAVGKPADQLNEWEKTQYYERMAFCIEIPSIRDTINNNELTLSVVGVRAYNHTNLYGRKGFETFKLAIGFINRVCTNLCISSEDGLLSEIRVSNISELQTQALELFRNYNAIQHLNQMKSLPQMSLTESQFATFLERTRLYQYLPKKDRKQLPLLSFGDSQLNMIAKDYYSDKLFCKSDDGYLNLWNLHNLFTNANRSSSYIDTFLDRGYNATGFVNGIAAALNGDNLYRWFIE